MWCHFSQVYQWTKRWKSSGEDITLSTGTPFPKMMSFAVLDKCLKGMYFPYKGEYYLQIWVCHITSAMGLPVSSIMCNIYMEDFKQRALAEANDPLAGAKDMSLIRIQF